MNVTCPKCRRVIPAKNLTLSTGWAKCGRCQELFRLQELVEGFTPAKEPEASVRPHDAWVIIEREPERLLIYMPPRGMRGYTWSLLVMAIAWLVFQFFFTLVALGILPNGDQAPASSIGMMVFSTPFWLAGFGMLVGVLWMSRGSRTIVLGASRMVTELRCMSWHRQRIIRRDQVYCARSSIIIGDGDGCPEKTVQVRVIFTNGLFTLPCSSEAEQAWLVSEINSFLTATPYRPASSSDFAGKSDWAWMCEIRR